MTPRPRLRTTHRPLLRGPGEVQLGTGDGALVLTGLPEPLVATLHRLDGATPLPAIRLACRTAGVPDASLDAFLDLLAQAGALDPLGLPAQSHHRTIPYEQVDALAHAGLADAPARDRLLRLARADVVVMGSGLLAEEICATLRTVCESTRLAGHPGSVAGTPAADVVIVVGHEALDPGVVGQAVLTAPCLPVLARAGGVVVGPWHADDRDPCPVCLDLRRADADDAWPRLLDQLAAADRRGLPRTVDPLARTLAASVAAQWVRRRLVGLTDHPGLTCEIDPWQMGLTHRVWPVHPRCTRHDPDLAVGA